MFKLGPFSRIHLLAALVLLAPPLAAQPADNESVFSGHLDAVTMGAFNPDGDAVVTTSFDHTARLWDVASRSELRQYAQHTGPVFCLAISGDGTTLVTGAQDNTLRVWDLPLGRPLRRLQPTPARATSFAFSPDGSSLVSASADQSIRIDSLGGPVERSESRQGHRSEVLSVAYRNDGAYFASGDANGRVVLWSPYLDEPQGEMTGQESGVNQLAFASNNQQLLTAGDDGLVRLWDFMPAAVNDFEIGEFQIVDWSVVTSSSQAVCIARDGKSIVLNLGNGQITSEYPKFDFQPTAITHAPNGTWVCVADSAGSAHILNFNDGSPRGTVAGHQGAVNGVAIHPDSTRFATCGADGKVLIWGQPTQGDEPPQPLQILHTDDEAPVAATCLVFAADQQHLLCGAADGRIRVWNIASGDLVRKIDAHSQSDAAAIGDLVIAPDSKTILTIGDDNTLRSFKFDDGSQLKEMRIPATGRDVAVSPDGSRAAVGCEDGIVRVWELASGHRLQSLGRNVAAVAVVDYLGDGQTIAAAAIDKSVRTWKTSIVRAMRVHNGPIRSMSLYGGGSQMITTGDDKRIVMTNVANGTETRQFRVLAKKPAADGPQSTAAYREINPTVVASRLDNQRVAAGTDDGALLVWNANDGEAPLLTFDLGARVTAVSFSPDNQKLAAATTEPAVHIFGPSIPGKLPQLELTAHQRFKVAAAVTDLAFAADNQSVWISTESGALEQWRYAQIAQRRQMNHGGPVYGVALSKDGKIAVSCSADQTVRVWETTTGRQKSQLRGHSGAVHAVAMSPDESLALSSGADGTLRLWDIVGGRQLKQLNKFDATLYSIAIHPEDQLVAAAGADRKVHLLDMITGSELRTLEGHSDYIHSISFDPSGQRLSSYGYAGNLRIWRSDDGGLLHESRVGKVGNYAQFSPDGSRLLISNGDGTARIISAP